MPRSRNDPPRPLCRAEPYRGKFFSFIQCGEHPGVGQRACRKTKGLPHFVAEASVIRHVEHHCLSSPLRPVRDGSKEEWMDVGPTTPPSGVSTADPRFFRNALPRTPSAPPGSSRESAPRSAVRRFPALKESVRHPAMCDEPIGAHPSMNGPGSCAIRTRRSGSIVRRIDRKAIAPTAISPKAPPGRSKRERGVSHWLCLRCPTRTPKAVRDGRTTRSTT
jgi:hypothetical protein